MTSGPVSNLVRLRNPLLPNHADHVDPMPAGTGRRLAVLVELGLITIVFCGCGKQPVAGPPTYPATGTVVDASDQPLTGGFVEFQSMTDQNMMAVGDIQEDGSFTLTTYVDGQPTEGAIVGGHRVTVHPPQIEHGGAPPVVLRKPEKIEAQENVFTLKLPRR